ncbi:MAG: cytosolic protein [Anaerolineae bacterium]|nr:cytosolic protein [Anaerolineae bacterium]
MTPLNQNDITAFVEQNIDEFHARRASSLTTLQLKQVLKRKNPYLFKAKHIQDAHDLVKLLLDAHLSSQEETIFGQFLEKLAVFVCGRVYGGRKSSAEGIDLEFKRGDTLYLVSIKSGPNWGNSSQVKRMTDNFKKAQRILRTSQSEVHIQAINGCCYGTDNHPDKGDYLKLCGQAFWEFISGNDRLYLEIIEPLGRRAKEHNEAFQKEYARILNLFTQEFIQEFCPHGVIDWEKLVRFNSQKQHSLQ